jgi:flagellar L-ring protein precursor FlgH
MKKIHFVQGIASLALCGCGLGQVPEPYVPSLRYSSEPETTPELTWRGAVYRDDSPKGNGKFKFLSGESEHPGARARMKDGALIHQVAMGNSDGSARPVLPPGVEVTRGGHPPYRPPLALGDPGVSASLWRESRAGNDIFRDFRAWQAMDLVTITVTERSRGLHDADTETKSKSQVLAAIENMLGFEQQTKQWKYPPDLSSLIQASTKNDFKGEGMTTRLAELIARISAVVVEVLPSGLLRIEGEKIIAVNNEEQVMVISGLVRQRDITSDNEVDSSKIAQLRIDYYGKGIVGEAQYGGWLGRMMRILWPF